MDDTDSDKDSDKEIISDNKREKFFKNTPRKLNELCFF